MSVKYKSYDLQFKLKAIERAEEEGNHATARALGIDRKRLREWRMQKVELQAIVQSEGEMRTNSKRRRLCGGGCTAKFANEEQIIADWILEQREQHFRVTRNMIAEKAKQVFEDNDFKASQGWMNNFMRRWNFTIRQKTTVGQSLPANLVPKVVNFIKFCFEQRATHAF